MYMYYLPVSPQIQGEFWTLVDSIQGLISRVPVSYVEETVELTTAADTPHTDVYYDTEQLKRELSELEVADDVARGGKDTEVKQPAARRTPDGGGSRVPTTDRGGSRPLQETGGSLDGAAAFNLLEENESSLSASEGVGEVTGGQGQVAITSKRMAKRKRQRARKKAQSDVGAAGGGPEGGDNAALPPRPPSAPIDGAAAGSGDQRTGVIPEPGPRYTAKMADIRMKVTNFCLDRKHARVVTRVGDWRSPILSLLIQRRTRPRDPGGPHRARHQY